MVRIAKASAVAALLALWLPGAMAQTFQLLTEEAYPFQYIENRRLTGMAVELVAEVFKRAGLPRKDEMLSWQDAYDRARAHPDTCVYSTARTEHREHLFKWVGPLVENKWAVFAKQGFKDPITQPKDLRQYRIGVLKADAKERYLESLGVDQLVAAADDAALPPRLTLDRDAAGGIDLWVTGYYAGARIAAKTGVTDVIPIRVFRTSRNYLACNPAVPDAVVAKMQAALDDMKRDGSHGRIVAKYVGRVKVK